MSAGSDAGAGVLHQEPWLACVGDVLANSEGLANAQPIGRDAWIAAAYHCWTGTSISIAGFLRLDYCLQRPTTFHCDLKNHSRRWIFLKWSRCEVMSYRLDVVKVPIVAFTVASRPKVCLYFAKWQVQTKILYKISPVEVRFEVKWCSWGWRTVRARIHTQGWLFFICFFFCQCCFHAHYKPLPG